MARRSQELLVEVHKAEDRLGEIARLDTGEWSEEIGAERDSLLEKRSTLHAQYEAAVAIEPDAALTNAEVKIQNGGTEAKEVLELRSACQLGNFALMAASGQTHPESPESEFMTEFYGGMRSGSTGVLVPPEMLVETAELAQGTEEHRAVTIPEAADANPEGRNVLRQPTLMRIFKDSVADRLGVQPVSVMPGIPTYLTLEGGKVFDTDTDQTINKGAAIAPSNSSYRAVPVAPRRIGLQYNWAVEDAAVLANLESDLRSDMVEAWRDGVDSEVVRRLRTTDGLDAVAVDGVITLAGLAELSAAPINEPFARTEQDVRHILGQEGYRAIASLFNAGTASTGAQFFRAVTGGVSQSSKLPYNATSKVSTGLFYRGGAGEGAVAPMWGGLRLIPDNITGAATGTVVLTAFSLMNVHVRRTDKYGTSAIQVEAA